MKRSTSYVIFLSCLMVVTTPLYAATQTLTTYYPAPQGNYKNMTVNSQLELPGPGVACAAGVSTDVYLANNGGYLEICDSSGTPHNLQTNTLWTGPASNLFMYPVNFSSENIGIGISTDPGYKLGVTGTFGVTGNATIGGVATLSSTLGVTGVTTLSSTLGVTGATTLNSTLGVTGATTLSSVTVNKGTTIQLCTAAGANCGTLEVAQGTDGNYYAVYGP
jgi:hypothetical protein